MPFLFGDDAGASSSGSVVITLSASAGAAAAAAAAMMDFDSDFAKGFDGSLESHEDDAAMTHALLLKFCTAVRKTRIKTSRVLYSQRWGLAKYPRPAVWAAIRPSEDRKVFMPQKSSPLRLPYEPRWEVKTD